MIIPYHALSPEALRGIMEEFITREGTDYGEVEMSLADKMTMLQPQLERGEVVIVFDETTERIQLVLKRDLDNL